MVKNDKGTENAEHTLGLHLMRSRAADLQRSISSHEELVSFVTEIRDAFAGTDDAGLES